MVHVLLSPISFFFTELTQQYNKYILPQSKMKNNKNKILIPANITENFE